MARYILDRDVSILIYGGHRTVGGNCIVVEDSKAGFKVMLDQGLNFQAYAKYFGGYIEPATLKELLDTQTTPPLEAYTDVSAVFISHLHLDHLGAMSLPEMTEAELYVPHVPILVELTATWENTWRKLLLPNKGVDGYAKTLREWRGVVKPVKVSHSAYPSYAFLVETSEGRVLYTGDFRLIASPVGIDTLAELERAVGGDGVDLLIAEGTNLGEETTPMDYELAERILDKVLSMYNKSILFMSYHPLDIETLVVVQRALSRHGYSLVLLHGRYPAIADYALSDLGLNEELYFYDIHGNASRRGFRCVRYIGSPSLCRLLKTTPTDKIAVALSYRAIDELRILANQDVELENTLLIHFTSELKGEEMRIMEARLGAWLRWFGMHVYRIRVSGHYYPHQLGEIIKAVKPKRTILVHTTFKTSCEAIKKD